MWQSWNKHLIYHSFQKMNFGAIFCHAHFIYFKSLFYVEFSKHNHTQVLISDPSACGNLLWLAVSWRDDLPCCDQTVQHRSNASTAQMLIQIQQFSLWKEVSHFAEGATAQWTTSLATELVSLTAWTTVWTPTPALPPTSRASRLVNVTIK